MANYQNATQTSVQIAILEDLEYYMHQVNFKTPAYSVLDIIDIKAEMNF